MDQNQQYQPQADNPLRNRPEPGRPNRIPAGRDMNLAAKNSTEGAGRKTEERQTAPPKKGGAIKNLFKFLGPIAGTAAATWGVSNLLS